MAGSLGLPTDMSAEELRQQVEGKLLDLKREPRNVQVVIREKTRVELCLLLVDEAGVFAQCGPVTQDANRWQEHNRGSMDEQQSREQAAQLEESHRQTETMCTTLEREKEPVEALERLVTSEKLRTLEAESKLEAIRTSVRETAAQEEERLKSELQTESS